MAWLYNQSVRGKRVWKECDVHGVLAKCRRSIAVNAKEIENQNFVSGEKVSARWLVLCPLGPAQAPGVLE